MTEGPSIAELAKRGPLFAWKLVDTVHADAVAAGSLRIGTLASYADLEGSRADPLDGAVDVAAQSLLAGVPEHDAAMERMGFRAGSIHGSRFVYRPKAQYVFCMSEVGCQHVPDPPKPRTMFQIADLLRLSYLLCAKNRERFTGEFGIDRVRYERVHYDALEAFPSPDPFVKDAKFTPEQEIRMTFTPREGHDPSPFNTAADDEVANLLTKLDYDGGRWV